MSRVLSDFSSAHVIRAIEANLQSCFASFSHLPNAVLSASPGLCSAVTTVPVSFFNGVAHAQFSPENLIAQIENTLAPFKSRSVPMRWWLTPSTRPADLAIHLEAQGLRHTADGTGMAIDLSPLQASPIPPNLSIEQVTNLDGLQRWVRGFTAGFGISEADAQLWFDVYSRVSFGPESPWRHYVGMMGDEPVATSSLLVGGGVPAVYHVVTQKPWRGQGIGTALTMEPLMEAQRRGYRLGVLQATAAGRPVYQRMGFKDYCQLRMYTWKPAPPAAELCPSARAG